MKNAKKQPRQGACACAENVQAQVAARLFFHLYRLFSVP